MKNLTIQKGLVCMTQAEFERLQAHLTESEREIARLTEALAAAESQRDKRSEEAENEFYRAEAAESDRDAANRLLGRAERYIPNGSLNDDLKVHLSGQPAAPTSYGTEDEYPGFNAAKPLRPESPTPESIRAASTQTPGIIDLSAALQESLRQPAAPARTETPELRPGCTHADYYEPAPTAAEVELAALRERVARAIAALTRNHVRRALEALRGR